MLRFDVETISKATSRKLERNDSMLRFDVETISKATQAGSTLRRPSCGLM